MPEEAHARGGPRALRGATRGPRALDGRRYPVVIVGEQHWERESLAFLCALLPGLHRSGVRCLAMEWLLAEDDELVERLVTAQAYDPELALEIARHHSSVTRSRFEVLRDPHHWSFAGGSERVLGDLACSYLFLAPRSRLARCDWLAGYVTERMLAENRPVYEAIGRRTGVAVRDPRSADLALSRQ